MSKIKFLFVGILFGIIMTKAEIISWLRIYEMFKFQSFHMYGVIGSAVLTGLIIIQLIKRNKIKSLSGADIIVEDKPKEYKANLIGGTIFGLGWAMTGACPGPLFTLIGSGAMVILVVLFSATLGTLVYGLVKHKLPH